MKLLSAKLSEIGQGKKTILQVCSGFKDSHAYIASKEFATKVINAMKDLLVGRKEFCANPWHGRSCGQVHSSTEYFGSLNALQNF